VIETVRVLFLIGHGIRDGLRPPRSGPFVIVGPEPLVAVAR
jgi:hypothetical protein